MVLLLKLLIHLLELSLSIGLLAAGSAEVYGEHPMSFL